VSKEKLRAQVKSIFDMQKIRIQMGNRLVASFRSAKEELDKATGSEKEVAKFLTLLSKEYDSIMEFVTMKGNTIKKYFRENELSDKLITDEVSFVLMEQYESLKSNEEKLKKSLKYELDKFPIYTEFLSK